MEVLEEAAVPGADDQDPAELVRGGARQREAGFSGAQKHPDNL